VAAIERAARGLRQYIDVPRQFIAQLLEVHRLSRNAWCVIKALLSTRAQ